MNEADPIVVNFAFLTSDRKRLLKDLRRGRAQRGCQTAGLVLDSAFYLPATGYVCAIGRRDAENLASLHNRGFEPLAFIVKSGQILILADTKKEKDMHYAYLRTVYEQAKTVFLQQMADDSGRVN